MNQPTCQILLEQSTVDTLVDGISCEPQSISISFVIDGKRKPLDSLSMFDLMQINEHGLRTTLVNVTQSQAQQITVAPE